MIVLSILLSCFRKGADPFSPARVYGFIWFFAIGLTDLKFSLFQHQWSLYAWTALLCGVVSFLLGTFINYLFNINKALLSIQEIRCRIQTEANIAIDSKRFFRIFIILFIAYMLAYLAEVIIEGGVPIFSLRPDVARIRFGVFGIHLIVNTMPILLFLILEYFILIKKHLFQKMIVVILFSVVVVSFFFLLQRFNFVVNALISLAFLHYSSRYLRPKNIWIFSILFLAMLIGIQSIRLT